MICFTFMRYIMDKNTIIEHFRHLTCSNQDELLKDLGRLKLSGVYSSILQSRGDSLDARRAECPYCKGANYHKNGTDKGSRRYKCKDCNRAFTEFTGTWIAGIHKKDKIPEFMKALEHKLSLIKSSQETGLDPCTIFQWRHKFLSSIENIEEDKPFKGITEADETYYLHSQKGCRCDHRLPRSRGGRPTRGLSKDEAVVFTTTDRAGNVAYKFASMGRVSAADITKTIGSRVSERTILCTDGYSSYKSFAQEQNLEHHILNISKGERVRGEYHIQHINSLHSRMNNLLNHNLKGVSTKYLQKYANWQKIKDLFKDSTQWIKTVLSLSLQCTDALKIYSDIQKHYLQLYKPSLLAS